MFIREAEETRSHRWTLWTPRTADQLRQRRSTVACLHQVFPDFSTSMTSGGNPHFTRHTGHSVRWTFKQNPKLNQSI
ncbi:hypothetical protein AOLI_G00244080 [Acnodon oligacanthus]